MIQCNHMHLSSNFQNSYKKSGMAALMCHTNTFEDRGRIIPGTCWPIT